MILSSILTLLKSNLSHSVVGQDHTKFGFYQFERFLFIVVIESNIDVT